MKQLILCEKPSVARDFAAALGCSQEESYLEGENFVITYCFGHLLELKHPEDYKPEWKEWKIETLPMIPQKFGYKPIQSGWKQLNAINKLFDRKDIGGVILATDAGREGELIGRLVLQYCNNKLPVKRFWSSEALTPETVRSSMERLRPIHYTDPLYRQGEARSIGDWVVGMNYSRLFSIQMKNTFSFGRVQTAVLSLICKRDLDIKNFNPLPYSQIIGNFSYGGMTYRGLLSLDGTSSFFEGVDLQPTLSRIEKAKSGQVSNLVEKEGSTPPPLLFNLTALQMHANKVWGYSAERTLGIAQSLYETHKCLSYPRTPSRVMGSNDAPVVRKKIDLLRGKYPDLFQDLNELTLNSNYLRVFNDSKLEDHHALIPLGLPPGNLSEEEKNIYDAVLKSFAAAFHDPCLYKSTVMDTSVDGVVFVSRGKVVVSPGWTRVFSDPEETGEDKEGDLEEGKLPRVAVGEMVGFDNYKVVSKKTKPPLHFTDATLLAVMENPKSYVSGEEIEFSPGMGLGTPATRHTMIEVLLKREYISRSKKKLLATEKGLFFYDSVSSSVLVSNFTKVDETARWEALLRDDPDGFLDALFRQVRLTLSELGKVDKVAVFKKSRVSVGVCPVCGSDVYEGKNSFYCSAADFESDDGCKFSLWKTVAGKVISASVASMVLAGKVSRPMDFVSKNGNKFSARLKLSDDYRFGFDFDK